MTSLSDQIHDGPWLNILLLGTTAAMILASKILGKTTGDISRNFSLRVTPPGIFFAIWGAIYLGLIVTGIYAAVGEGWSALMKLLFLTGNILNGLWLYVFGFGTSTCNNICLFILLSMAVLNEALWFLSLKVSTGSTWDIVNCNIIAFYQGWLVVASNLNAGVVLVYSLGLSKNKQASVFWITAPLCVLGMVLVNLRAPNGFKNNIAMYVTAIFGLVGAAISYQKGEEMSSEMLQGEEKEK
jgi:hypothetical protein